MEWRTSRRPVRVPAGFIEPMHSSRLEEGSERPALDSRNQTRRLPNDPPTERGSCARLPFGTDLPPWAASQLVEKPWPREPEAVRSAPLSWGLAQEELRRREPVQPASEPRPARSARQQPRLWTL